jgi:hypothetical protein
LASIVDMDARKVNAANLNVQPILIAVMAIPAL